MAAVHEVRQPSFASSARYRVEGELARGGMGIVYRAWDNAQRRMLALNEKPLAPSHYAPDVPSALDELVLALLALAPLARPASAGEVIDRLEAVAELARDDDERVVKSYLRNPNLVGRAEPRARIARRLGRLAEGVGSTILIDGAVGQGKSAMLLDLQREARLRGALVVAVNAQVVRPCSASATQRCNARREWPPRRPAATGSWLNFCASPTTWGVARVRSPRARVSSSTF